MVLNARAARRVHSTFTVAFRSAFDRVAAVPERAASIFGTTCAGFFYARNETPSARFLELQSFRGSTMAKEKHLSELFHDTLKDIYFAEKKILGALPKMAKAAQSEESDVIPCWAPDSRRSAPCGRPIIAAPRTAEACVIQAI